MLKIIKRLPFYRAYTTKQNQQYWLRKNDPKYWEEYVNTWKDERRGYISAVLSRLDWLSLIEVGCGSGANLINIVKHMPNKQLGGVDINPVAIEVARKNIIGAILKVGPSDDILMSDNSVDVILSDAHLIYVGPFQIRKYLKELKRVSRKYIVLCEYYDPSFFRRWKLRLFSGRHAYDYPKLLEQLGFYDIEKYKLPKIGEDNDHRFRWIITAKSTGR